MMSTKAAEITKIAVNCFLTTKISYANMLGEVLSLSGLDDEIENGKISKIYDRLLNLHIFFRSHYGHSLDMP